LSSIAFLNERKYILNINLHTMHIQLQNKQKQLKLKKTVKPLSPILFLSIADAQKTDGVPRTKDKTGRRLPNSVNKEQIFIST